ncbi:MAG: hypothetical protein ACJ746_29860 [Bryobacteraceae bacterium]
MISTLTSLAARIRCVGPRGTSGIDVAGHLNTTGSPQIWGDMSTASYTQVRNTQARRSYAFKSFVALPIDWDGPLLRLLT